jgi:hypothetical protein
MPVDCHLFPSGSAACFETAGGPFSIFVHYLPMSQDEALQFRRQAEHCRQQAEKAISPLDRNAWLRTAGEWTKLAVTIEERRP